MRCFQCNPSGLSFVGQGRNKNYNLKPSGPGGIAFRIPDMTSPTVAGAFHAGHRGPLSLISQGVGFHPPRTCSSVPSLALLRECPACHYHVTLIMLFCSRRINTPARDRFLACQQSWLFSLCLAIAIDTLTHPPIQQGILSEGVQSEPGGP